MITSLELNGFKSFLADTLNLGKLTILTGLNSSGKSSIMQAVLLLQKAANKEPIFLEGHGNITECLNPYSKEGIQIEAVLNNGEKLAIHNDRAIVKGKISFPEVIYISADRFGPETSVSITSENDKLGNRGENIFKCIETYADYPLHELLIRQNSEGDTLLFNLRAWLGVISPNVKFEHNIQLMSDSSYGTFNGHRAKNVGFGLSYGLTVITALLLGSITPGSIVMIENPEAHLHPRGQVEMAQLICLCVEAGVQVIIETHSDHLFDGVRVYAKNSKVDFHECVSVYWFELDKNDNTNVEPVVIDKNGRIDEWPKGLFDQFEINATKLL